MNPAVRWRFRCTSLMLPVAVSMLGVPSAESLSASVAGECEAAGSRFICTQGPAEDLVPIPGTYWVLASAYGGKGGIHGVNARDRTITALYPAAAAADRFDRDTYPECPGPLDADARARFLTHGLALGPSRDGRHVLLVVHHEARESVEVFELDTLRGMPSLIWVGCIPAPDPVRLNSVVALPEGGFLATQFRARGPGVEESTRRMRAGEPNGAIWRWQPGAGWSVLPGSEGSGLNGIELSPDGETVYVAGWGSRTLIRLPIDNDETRRVTVDLDFRPDNVRWDTDGRLLVAGQTIAVGQEPAASKVVRIDPRTLIVSELHTLPDTGSFSRSSVAIQVDREIWVGSVGAHRIAVLPAVP